MPKKQRKWRVAKAALASAFVIVSTQISGIAHKATTSVRNSNSIGSITSFITELNRRGFLPASSGQISEHHIDHAIKKYFVSVPTSSVLSTVIPALTDQEQQVSQIAAEGGDNAFLMVDKIHGRIILFEGGRPSFSAPALTGAHLADIIPAGAFTRTLQQQRPEDKVTPAGRFTVTNQIDREYGEILLINEVHAARWKLAIHPVCAKAACKRRDMHLLSPNDAYKHMTYGCVNVDQRTINYLTRWASDKKNIPLYILPQDPKMTVYYFPHRAHNQVHNKSIIVHAPT